MYNNCYSLFSAINIAKESEFIIHKQACCPSEFSGHCVFTKQFIGNYIASNLK